MNTNNMKSKFWTFLGGLLKFEAPLWNWRQRLEYDFDFEAFRDIYLQPTDKMASLIICPKNCDYSCGFRKIKENEDGSFRAVCHKKKKDSFLIANKELLLYKVNYGVLLPKIAQVLGIQPQIAPYQTWEEAWKMGTLPIGNRNLPVFFTLRNWNHKIISLILDLNRMGSGPYILLVTSSEVISPTSIKALEDSGSLFIPVNEILDFNENAEPILTRPLDSYFENMPGFLPHVEAEAEPENIFRKCGDAWEIRFQGGEKFMLYGVDTGAMYIHYLLEHSGARCNVLEITRQISNQTTDGKVSNISMDEFDTLSISNMPITTSNQIADSQAIEQYRFEAKQLLAELEEARNQNDFDNITRLQTDLDLLSQAINDAISPYGQQKNLDDYRRNAESAFRNAVNRAIRKISPYDKKMSRHLERCIQCGIEPVYLPGEKIDWCL